MTRSAAKPTGGRDDARAGRDAGPTDAPADRDVRLTDHDLYLFNEGTHFRLYDKLGAHVVRRGGEKGVAFAVWAPSARRVSVVGDFNGWDHSATPMNPRANSGIWETVVPGLEEGAVYKYRIESGHSGYVVQKADPLGFAHEHPPKTASVVRGLDYEWSDADWMLARRERHTVRAPISIYELHLGSWRRKPEDGNRPLTYRELAEQLPDYVKARGFTHVEFLPVMEHPLYASWGYQTTGYFAPTSRYGSPQDFMRLVDGLHQAGVGVILDWVPSHFPSDEHGPGYFDGTHLYEHADPRLGFHPDWKSLIFNYSRHEVRSFLISSAMFWLEKYHVDGIRVDAVASMLYRDYSRKEGEWLPNEHGGRENLEAVDFLRRLNTEIYRSFPDVQTFAEESTAWPMVSRPVYIGGLGFGFKWDMGWMHDTLQYLGRDPVHRAHHHGEITFRALYQFTENYTLPLSHDEVVHGKGSLAGKLAGSDAWQKLATLRLLLAYQWSQPGKKLLFMGCELGQWSEWNHDQSLDWHLLDTPEHAGIVRLVDELNRLYRELPALHEHDCDPAGFQWVDASDSTDSVLSYLRRAGEQTVLCAFNFTPVVRHNYLLGVPAPGRWNEILNTDATGFGGSGTGNLGAAETHPLPRHGHPQALRLTLPPLGAVWLGAEGSRE
jgi:1,4-alpha-glucan branching enzyme